jgi:hypothetical protein
MRIVVHNQAYLGSDLQLAVLAFARCEYVGARNVSCRTLDGITVIC